MKLDDMSLTATVSKQSSNGSGYASESVSNVGVGGARPLKKRLSSKSDRLKEVLENQGTFELFQDHVAMEFANG